MPVSQLLSSFLAVSLVRDRWHGWRFSEEIIESSPELSAFEPGGQGQPRPRDEFYRHGSHPRLHQRSASRHI